MPLAGERGDELTFFGVCVHQKRCFGHTLHCLNRKCCACDVVYLAAEPLPIIQYEVHKLAGKEVGFHFPTSTFAEDQDANVEVGK